MKVQTLRKSNLTEIIIIIFIKALICEIAEKMSIETTSKHGLDRQYWHLLEKNLGEWTGCTIEALVSE